MQMQSRLHYSIQSQPAPPVMNLYDFDGVLSHSLEEALFQMPVTRHDEEFIRKVSQLAVMDLSQESRQSARYICMQAILWYNRIPIRKGPITPDYRHPYYILTARSDRFAVRRMHEFVMEYLRPEPIKTQHLDHLPKGQAIAVLLERHPDTMFTFYDDNIRHIESAASLKTDRLCVVHVDNSLPSLYTEADSFYRNTILELAL